MVYIYTNILRHLRDLFCFCARGSLALDTVGGLDDDDDLAMDRVVQQSGSLILVCLPVRCLS